MIMNSQRSNRITLGASDLRVSPLGVGTNSWGVNRKADPGLQSTFDAALNMGINFFDTAEMYGFGGSERTLGQFLPTAGQTAIVATKFFPLPWRLRKSNLTAALRDSLVRLQMAQVDLYMIHMPIPPVSIETWMDALADAMEAGLTRAVGVSNYNAVQMKQAHAALAKRGIALACNQVGYSLLKRDVERKGLLALCRELDVMLIAYQPLAIGLLTGKYTPANRPKGLRRLIYNREYLSRIQPIIGLLRQLGKAHGGKSPSQVALNWLICKGALPIPGAKNMQQVQENAGALGWRLSDDAIAALDEASEKISRSK
jgi:aryl-alcohol dehydrogenase-like predicted oxidoreductase